MKKYIIPFIISVLLISVFAFAANANEQYTVTYDYGIADIFSENIVNENPAVLPYGASHTLSPAECQGFDFAGWFTDDGRNNEITELSASNTDDITLYAKWYECTYAVNYVLTSADSSITTADISNNNPISRKTSDEVYLAEPVCVSGKYVFMGWYTDSTFSTQITQIDAYTTADITLYAKWQGTEYPILYDMGDAANSTYLTDNPNPDFYVYDQEIVLKPAYCSNPDFVFDGWYEDSLFTYEITKISAGNVGSAVIYAKWIIKEYNINYILADNSGIDVATVSHSNPLTRPSGTAVVLSMPISSDKNYEFDGWYTTPDFAEKSKITEIKATTPADITIYAKWVIAVYEINYDYAMINPMYLKIDNPNPTKYKFGEKTSLAPVSANGFIFNGWCTDAERKNIITSLPADTYGDITLYADFTEMTYIISYVLGSDDVAAESVVNHNTVFVRTTTEQISLKEAQTLDTTYKFDGWYLDEDYINEVEYIRAYTVGNITLYAKWIKNVTYIPVWGDASLSDEITAADARLILRYSAGLEQDFTDLQKQVSDINRDSKTNAADARIVLRLSANIDDIDDLTKEYNLPEITEKNGEIVFVPNEE